ncbi:MAG: DUF3373 family protein [Campylobacter sp.]|nr:DUF3373 family protein [Campylobacter sp.]
MKKFSFLLSFAVATALFANDDISELKKEIEALKAQVNELKALAGLKSNQVAATQQVASTPVSTNVANNAEVEKNTADIKSLKTQVSKLNAKTGGDNVKFDIDFRTAYDDLHYKYNGAKNQHNGIWTNKLILGMQAQPVDNLAFKGSLAAYKIFGQNNIANSSYFQNFDWYDTQKPNDTALRIREAYFLYFGSLGEIPFNFSFGRRPSLDGFLTNLRADNANPGSPIGHNINMQFDGASFKFDLDKITDIPGLYLKLCLGRGFSDTLGAYSMNMNTMGFNPGYINDEYNPDMDLAGLIVQFYDDGQYKVMGNYFYAKNMMDMNIKGMAVTPLMGQNPVTGQPMQVGALQKPYFNFVDVGDMQGGALSVQVNGIGDGISDFLDDTVVFASWAFSKTKPNSNPVYSTTGLAPGMLGTTDSKFGQSFYVGVQMPGFMDGHKFGLEYNHGSKYWRSFTYGEDTLVGSKLAARGNAYETYYTLPLVGKNLTASLSYLLIDYDYTGSDTFFGWTGTPMDVDNTPGAVKRAQQIRAYLRYRY